MDHRCQGLSTLNEKRLLSQSSLKTHPVVVETCLRTVQTLESRTESIKEDSTSTYMHGVGSSDPGLGEVMGVCSGQRLEEVVLLITVDRRQVGSVELTV